MNQITLGQRIALLRRQKELTQETLAEALGVSPQAVSKWENEVSHSKRYYFTNPRLHDFHGIRL